MMPVVLEEFGSKLDARCHLPPSSPACWSQVQAAAAAMRLSCCLMLANINSRTYDGALPVWLLAHSCIVDGRAGQFKTSYDSCLASAKRDGACAGVMFWDLTHAVSVH